MELFVKTEKGMEVTPEFKLLQLKSRFRELFPLGVTKEELKSLWTLFKSDQRLEEASKGNAVVYMTEDVLNPLLLYMFVSRGSKDPFILMNAYSLIEIYLGHNENITSIEQLESQLIVLYMGYSEFENKRQADIIMQLIEQQIIRRGNLWIVYKGSDDSFANKYRDLSVLLTQRKFKKVIINPRSRTSFEEI